MSFTTHPETAGLWGGLVVAIALWPLVWLVHCIRRGRNRLLLLALPRSVDQHIEQMPLAA
jgi:hypothetical protein